MKASFSIIRISKNIQDSVRKRGPAFAKVFEYCYEYKHGHMKQGRETPVCDKLVFNKIRKLLGGRMRFVLVGGAPLSGETHDFIRTCLGVVLVQGYSLTESCCTGTVMENRDLGTGTVGLPMTGEQYCLHCGLVLNEQLNSVLRWTNGNNFLMGKISIESIAVVYRARNIVLPAFSPSLPQQRPRSCQRRRT